MSIVLALLGALRAALRTCTNLTLENLALRQQLALLRTDRSDHGPGAWIASSGCGSPADGPGGEMRCISFAPRPCFAGTGRASASSGPGNPAMDERVDRPSRGRLRI